MSTNLLNKKATRAYILSTLKEMRPALKLTQVSGEAYDAIEASLRSTIRDMIHSHPSLGKTFKP